MMRRLTSSEALLYGRPSIMRSAPSVLIPGRLDNCSLLALFTSKGLSRFHPSLTPSASAFASCLIADVACAVLSRTSSGLDFCEVHPPNRKNNGPANAAIFFPPLRCAPSLRGWSRFLLIVHQHKAQLAACVYQ